MTEAEFLALPDREKDRLVAEKMMGYRFYLELRGGYRGSVWVKPGEREPWKRRQSPDPERYQLVGWKDANDFFGSPPPRFSTDINAAWEVVESGVFQDGFVLERICGYWYAYDDKERPVQGRSTAPLAICVSALKVKGIIE